MSRCLAIFTKLRTDKNHLFSRCLATFKEFRSARNEHTVGKTCVKLYVHFTPFTGISNQTKLTYCSIFGFT